MGLIFFMLQYYKILEHPQHIVINCFDSYFFLKNVSLNACLKFVDEIKLLNGMKKKTKKLKGITVGIMIECYVCIGKIKNNIIFNCN